MPVRVENHLDSSERSECRRRSKVCSGVSPAKASNLERISGKSFASLRRSFTANCSRMTSRWLSCSAATSSLTSCSKLIEGLTTTGFMSVRFSKWG